MVTRRSPQPKKIADEAAKGRVEGLQALRDRLARQIDGCESARDVAALSQRLMDVLSQLAALEADTPKGTVLDEIAQRRRDRAAKAASTRRTSREGS